MKRIVIVAILGLALSGCSKKFSADQIDAAKKDCVGLYRQSFNPFPNEVTALDNWSKEGKLVVQVGEQQGMSDSYSTKLCVVDEQAGTLDFPAPLSRDAGINDQMTH